MSALLIIAVVTFGGIVHFKRCCSTSGLFAVTSFHIKAISSAVSGSPSGNAMHMTRNLSLLTGWICWPFWITTFMFADVIGESVPEDGRTLNLSGAVVLTWKTSKMVIWLQIIPFLFIASVYTQSSGHNLNNKINGGEGIRLRLTREFHIKVKCSAGGKMYEMNMRLGKNRAVGSEFRVF